MIDAVFVVFTDTEHHGRGGAHAELVGGAVNIEPVVGEALQARNLESHFVVKDFCATTGN